MTARMPVVRLDAQSSVTIIGWCHAQPQPDDLPCWIAVNEPMRATGYTGEEPLPMDKAGIRFGHFQIIEIRHPAGWRGIAIHADNAKAPLDWLPGWRPA